MTVGYMSVPAKTRASVWLTLKKRAEVTARMNGRNQKVASPIMFSIADQSLSGLSHPAVCSNTVRDLTMPPPTSAGRTGRKIAAKKPVILSRTDFLGASPSSSLG